mgnify:FL=1
MTITLVRNPDILKSVYQLRQNPTDLTQSQQENLSQLAVVVGFAAESENLLDNAQSKVERKGLDFIVANNISAADAGFAVDTNRVVFLHKDGSRENLDLMSKTKVAEQIIERIAGLLE